MQNQAYWEARSLARSAVYNRSATRVVNITQHAVERSLDTLKREIDDVLRVYSKRHSLTREEALALLRSPVDMATQKRLEAEIASITDPAARRMMQAKIEASSYAARLTRAQAMQDRIVLESVKVAEVEQEALKNHLAFTYMDGIDRFMYDASRGVGRMFEYARPSVKEAQEVLRHRWAGGNYSSRVWGNANYMVKSLETALTENMLAGKPGKETWQELVNAAGGVVSHAQRLIRTETAYIAGQAEKQGYERAGFAEYKFVARLEAITCPVCGKLDGQLFPVRDAVAGKNLPPIHPWCRCTTMPWDKAVEAAMNDSDTRWAKDPETGKTVEVPMSMTYEEWKKAQRKYNSDNGIMPMSEGEYLDWQKDAATSKIIKELFVEKYGVTIDEAMGAKDRWLDEEDRWLSDAAQQNIDDLVQVTNGYGHCGYIQAADGSKAINAYLRRGEVGMYSKREMQKTIDAMNRLIRTTALDKDIVVDRCAGIDSLERMGVNVGAHGKSFRIGHAFCTDGLDVDSIVKTINKEYSGFVLQDKGFMSASASPKLNVFGGSDVTFTITAPKGTNAFISDNISESELVFAPGTRQRIVNARVIERSAFDYDGKETKRKVVEVVLEIIGE